MFNVSATNVSVINLSSIHIELVWLTDVIVFIAFKYFAVVYRFKGEDAWKQQSRSAADMAFRYHGSASGTILGDEAERSLAPYSAHELCTVVETIYSFSYMYAALGDNTYADRAERAAFNAYPVMLTGDKWAHQYMNQPNGPQAINVTRDFTDLTKPFTNSNSGMALAYGLEPNFPCCAVNHPQGYPRFISGSWVRVGSDGLAHALLSPSTIETKLGANSVKVTCTTNYPFTNRLVYTIQADHAFALHLRVPSWSDPEHTTVTVENLRPSVVRPDSQTGLHKITIPSGKVKVKVTYNLDMQTYTESRPNNTVAIYHGSILYALDIGYSETSSLPHSYTDPTGPGLTGMPEQVRDYQINNTQPWNVAVDLSTLEYHGMEDESANLPNPLFNYGSPPTYFTVQGCTINWPLYLDTHPDWAPSDRNCTGPQKRYRLNPLGGQKIHMADLPVTSFK